MKKDLHSSSKQPSLFSQFLKDGALDRRMAFRNALTEGFRAMDQSRFWACAEISRLSGHEISKSILDRCTSNDFGYGVRAEDLPAILYVIQTIEPARILLEPLNCEFIGPLESKLLLLAKLERKNKCIQSELVRLREELGVR